MNVTIHKVHVDLTDQQHSLIEKKITRLEKFRDHINAMDLYIKKVHGKKDNRSVELELKILVPGQTIVVSERAPSIEEAIDKVLRTASRQLRKYKERK